MTMRFGSVLCGVALLAACNEPTPGTTYYERDIEPILVQSCARNVAGCHQVDEDDPFGFAAGNFDVTSFENVQKRRDLLQPFGPYSIPVLLIKAVGGAGNLSIAYGDDFLPLEVQHAGGSNLQVGSQAYLTLLTWMENGATENGLPPPAPQRSGSGGCSTMVPDDFDPAPQLANAGFDRFVAEVQPVLEGCSAATCHGAPQSDFYITCGSDDAQLAFNFYKARAFVDATPDNSQLLQVPLSVASGGFFHTGGDHFKSREAANYLAIRGWAESVGPIDFGQGDRGRQFFADNVQPILLARGCSFEACHSPSATNDFKLRSGGQGFFSPVALEKNYELFKNDFMALEVPDARRGRAVAKNVLPRHGGIAHRGGAILETPGAGGATPAACPVPFDPDGPAFCVLQEWVRLEREELAARGEVSPMAPADTLPLIYVERQESHVATPLELDIYQPGSDLLLADATLGEDSRIVEVGPSRSLLDGCPGAGDRATVDVRGPDVRFDGTTIAFAMRTAASDPFGIYVVDVDGSGCRRLTAAEPPQNGIAIHNVDPAWAPDGQSIVFASTKGGASGPSVSRALFLPQTDLWRMDIRGGSWEQVTFLTNSEISPQMLREGRIIMTTEKVSEGFYQLAGRRINWDLTDYHPLLGQRSESPLANTDDPMATLPSIGYQQATELREGLDGNFLVVLSDAGARGGAGTLAIFNRSIGPHEEGRTDPGYLPSMYIVDRAATGRVGATTSGVYRSPHPLPSGQLMASWANYSGDLATAQSLAWDVVAIEPRTGARQMLIGGPGAQVEAVLAIRHPPRALYYNRRQLVFGGTVNQDTTGGSDEAVVHFPDAPQVFTLLGANLRRGRPAFLFRDATQLAAYREAEAPAGASGSRDDIFEQRTLIGRAPLAEDGSIKVRVPARTPLVFELQDERGQVITTMREEHQMGPGEVISLGIRQDLFDAVCGGCHGSVSGRELDVHLEPDALTGASESLSASEAPASLSD